MCLDHSVLSYRGLQLHWSEMVNRSRLCIGFVLILSMIPSPAAASKKLTFFVLKPPANFLRDVKTIVVFDFQQAGDLDSSRSSDFSPKEILKDTLTDFLSEPEHHPGTFGERFAASLSANLARPNRGIHRVKRGILKHTPGRTFQAGSHTDLYRIISHSDLRRLSEADQLPSSETISEALAVQIGEKLGAQAVLLGSIWYDGKTNDFKETEKCRQVSAATLVEYRAVRVPDGTHFATHTVSMEDSESACESDFGSTYLIPHVEELIARTLQRSADAVASQIAPRFVEVVLGFEKIKTSPYRKNANRAIKMAVDYRLDEAYAILQPLVDQHPTDSRLWYNLGILHEAVGNLGKSEECYQMARSIEDKVAYETALWRVAIRKNDVKELAEMGITLAEHSFE